MAHSINEVHRAPGGLAWVIRLSDTARSAVLDRSAEFQLGRPVGGGQTMTSRAVVFGPGGGLLPWDGRL